MPSTCLPNSAGAAPSAELATALLEWATASGRRPPWRQHADFYALAVAEILLQKTKGTDAEPVWNELIRAFPDAGALAAAPDETVAALVARLGLRTQRTARLKALAGALCEGGTGGKLAGLGPYGSAITALASGQEPATAPVDGNVARVISRVYGFSFPRGEPRKKPEVKAAVMDLLASQTAPAQQLEIAYGLVDLGALICRPARPDCMACPLSAWCRSSRTRSG